MAASTKDTIYVDVDDEITTIIDKVRASDARIVALVLPKRASVFQSIVNMKLLKRTAEAAKKHVVLVTTEPNLMPLAAAVGLHVAPTPQSKPEIPSAAEPPADTDEPIEEPDDEDGYSAKNAGHRPVGELAGPALLPADSVETVDLPDEEDEEPDVTDEEAAAPSRNRHLKVPNFNKFRLRLFLGVLAIVVLGIALYVAAAVLPKATIAITTNASTVNVGFNMTLDTAAQALDEAKRVLPAKTEQQQKTTTQQVATTGQKNTGEVAAGTVTMTAGSCSPDFPNGVPAGTGVSTNGLTYITQANATFGVGNVNGKCVWQASGVPVTAQSAGAKYNVSNATFTVAGRSDVSATGSASGGTDNIVQVVAQADIDSATQKLASQDTEAVKTSLEQALTADGMYPIPATFNAGTPVITSSNQVGDAVANVTVTQAVTYTMYGVKQNDLTALVQANIKSQTDLTNQGILDNGISNGKFGVVTPGASSEVVSLQTTATIGPDISAADIKKQSAGKKAGDVKSAIGGIPGVTSVDVRLSPFWVSAVPKDMNKVTVTISGAK